MIRMTICVLQMHQELLTAAIFSNDFDEQPHHESARTSKMEHSSLHVHTFFNNRSVLLCTYLSHYVADFAKCRELTIAKPCLERALHPCMSPSYCTLRTCF